METQRWPAIVSRIVPYEADDLDDLLAAHDLHRGKLGREIFPDVAASLLPDVALVPSDTVCVGVRVSVAPEDAAERALRLVCFAAERSVEVIILAETDTTGFERFGFRIERVVGAEADARSRCEAQICRFWNIDFIL